MANFNSTSYKNWERTSALIGDIYADAIRIFNRKWQEGSLWEWLEHVVTASRGFVVRERNADLDVAFFVAILQQNNIVLLQMLQRDLGRMEAIFGGAAVASIASQLDLQESFAKAMPQSTAQKQPNDLSVAATNLVASYKAAKESFGLVAAALVCSLPPETPATFRQYQMSINRLKDVVGNTPLQKQATVLRYLGQSFFGRDETMIQETWRVFITEFKIGYQPAADLYKQLRFVLSLYLVVSGFSARQREDRCLFISTYFWQALQLGVPMRNILEDVLADELFINDYLTSSGSFADAMLGNVEPLGLPSQPSISITVGRFIQDFLVSAGANYSNRRVMANFISQKITQNTWPAELASQLVELLDLFVHLRECDLIDYRGILSDVKFKLKQYDWREVIKKDLNEDERAEIKRHLSLLHRPLRTKMDMVVAFESVPAWNQEPYLSRILELDSIYQQACGNTYQPLIYFDEAADQWRFYKDIPDIWGIVPQIQASYIRQQIPLE